MGLYFPMFVDIENKKILVIGAGHVAVRRLRTLLAFGADLAVVAKEVPAPQEEEMRRLLGSGRVHLTLRPVEAADITAQYAFVICAADDPAADRLAQNRCRELGIPVNIASDRDKSDFYFPAVALTDGLAAGLAGDGSDHGKVARAARAVRGCLAGLEADEGKQAKEDEGDRA